MHPLFELQNIRQHYHDRTVLDIASLRLEAGHIYALTGPNGAGKSTLLRLLAFLEEPTAGRLFFCGEQVRFSSRTALLNLRRRVVLVDQHPVAFSTTVAKNVEFGLKIRKMAKKQRQRLVAEVLDTVGLSQYCHGPANELSGGETQRLALARALAIQPEVLLCDEPTANVDVPNQHIILDVLSQINHKHSSSIIFTTHDQKQAEALAQHGLHLERGCLEYHNAA
ncbi:MAG: energy-coupling factor ABC transporter ATP-binding protein [Desulfobulbus sp.]|jgi:tungstate transport system ATP-binding protein